MRQDILYRKKQKETDDWINRVLKLAVDIQLARDRMAIFSFPWHVFSTSISQTRLIFYEWSIDFDVLNFRVAPFSISLQGKRLQDDNVSSWQTVAVKHTYIYISERL